eukprot:TRINITY_DN9568_c0_g1_i5.p1 TRINITY_DN9568_c0_g1~~TRINITY_DN9568_c0_g1_i5.p1  ORF type:complete len:349 (-),score=68.37 TRINITY_DN9568_c0_g1_i5:116-1099(-)
MLRSLVGSEMCIRDRTRAIALVGGEDSSCEGDLLFSITDGHLELGTQMEQHPHLRTTLALEPGVYQLDATYSRATREAKIFVDGLLRGQAHSPMLLPLSGSITVASGCHSVDAQVLQGRVWGFTLYECSAGGGCPVSTNLALDRTVDLSSHVKASRDDGCVDGNLQTSGVCRTAREYEPWIRVDLGGSVTVSSVKLWGARNCSCQLGAFRVELQRSADDLVPVAERDFTVHCVRGEVKDECAGHASEKSFEWVVPLGTRARYLLVQQEFRTGYLELSGIQVWGCQSSEGLHGHKDHGRKEERASLATQAEQGFSISSQHLGGIRLQS